MAIKIKDIPNYDGLYRIDELGNVYGQRWNKPLKVRNHNGYAWIGLYDKNKNRKMWSVHRLMALTFLPNPEHKSTVNHKDGNGLNNVLANLEWATYKENIDHAVVFMGMNCGERQWRSKLTKDDVLNIFYSQEEPAILAKRYDTSRNYILRIQGARAWKWLLKPIAERRVLHGI